MRAWRVETPGAVDALELVTLPDPSPDEGWVHVAIRGFGLNRSEVYTRRGQSGDAVPFPRVLGIECVGEVIAAPGTELQAGQKVAVAMGGLGRVFDGGYAEQTVAPRSQVMPFDSELPWDTLAALPETYYTAWTSLFDECDLQAGQTLFIRGGTSSVGMAATSIAKHLGCRVIATTRKEHKRQALLAAGVDDVVIDGGSMAAAVRELVPDGVDAALELVGRPETVGDTSNAIRKGGHLCHTGLLGDVWDAELPGMPEGVSYSFGNSERVRADKWTSITQTIVDRAAEGHYAPHIFRAFAFEEVREAHQMMEDSAAAGKLVVLT